MAATVSPPSSEPPSPHQHEEGAAPRPNTAEFSPSLQEQQQKAPLFLGFNQDCGRLACGNEAGFRVYECDPFKEAYSRESSDGGGIGYVELLFRSDILAIVGGGSSPKYSPNKVMIWDNNEGKCIGELSFRSQVRAVKLRRDRIVVVLEHKIYAYNFADLKLLLQIDTISNPKGLCALSSTTDSSVLACPGVQQGQVRVEHYRRKKTKFIAAHDSHLASLVLSLDGRLLATASNKGTLIRVFDTMDGTLLQELRRGADRAEIYSIAFSGNAQWLAVSSGKHTIHVFRLKALSEITGGRNSDEGQVVPTSANQLPGNGNSAAVVIGTSMALNSNPSSTFSFMRGVLPRYFSSEWSFSQFRLPEETKSIVAFGPEKHTVMVVGTDGSFYRCVFDPVHGGEMTQREHVKFIKQETTIAT